MSNKVKIAIDTMGGENSPKKIIDGIEISLKSNQEIFLTTYFFYCADKIFLTNHQW